MTEDAMTDDLTTSEPQDPAVAIAPADEPASAPSPGPDGKSAHVTDSKRGGIESWDCSACGYFTHGDRAMVEAHIAATHGTHVPRVTRPAAPRRRTTKAKTRKETSK